MSDTTSSSVSTANNSINWKEVGSSALKGAGIAVLIFLIYSMWKAELIQPVIKSKYFWILFIVIVVTYMAFVSLRYKTAPVVPSK